MQVMASIDNLQRQINSQSERMQMLQKKLRECDNALNHSRIGASQLITRCENFEKRKPVFQKELSEGRHMDTEEPKEVIMNSKQSRAEAHAAVTELSAMLPPRPTSPERERPINNMRSLPVSMTASAQEPPPPPAGLRVPNLNDDEEDLYDIAPMQQAYQSRRSTGGSLPRTPTGDESRSYGEGAFSMAPTTDTVQSFSGSVLQTTMTSPTPPLARSAYESGPAQGMQQMPQRLNLPQQQTIGASSTVSTSNMQRVQGQPGSSGMPVIGSSVNADVGEVREKIFNMLDRDGDGLITRDEFTQAMGRNAQTPPAPPPPRTVPVLQQSAPAAVNAALPRTPMMVARMPTGSLPPSMQASASVPRGAPIAAGVPGPLIFTGARR